MTGTRFALGAANLSRMLAETGESTMMKLIQVSRYPPCRTQCFRSSAGWQKLQTCFLEFGEASKVPVEGAHFGSCHVQVLFNPDCGAGRKL